MPQTEKCPRCGWFDGKRFHICIVPTVETAVTREIEYEERVLTPSRPLRNSQREAISESQKERWRSVNLERDTKIVERYMAGQDGSDTPISYTGLATEFGVSRSTIINVMKGAVAAGILEARSAGTNIKNGG